MITTAIAMPPATGERATPLLSLGPWRCGGCGGELVLLYWGVADGWTAVHAIQARQLSPCPAIGWWPA